MNETRTETAIAVLDGVSASWSRANDGLASVTNAFPGPYGEAVASRGR